MAMLKIPGVMLKHGWKNAFGNNTDLERDNIACVREEKV